MGSKEYWAERERAKQLKVDEITDVEVEKVRDAIDKAINSLDNEIHRIYMKYAVDNEMSYADTLKYLTNDERKEFQKDLQYYIEKNRDTEYVKKHAKELHSLSVRARVKRIEAFIAKIKQHSADLEELINNGTREQISSLYTEGYLRQTYELSGGLTPEKSKIASAFNTRAVRQILDTPWSGSNYSDKVWNITDSFTDKLQQTLTQGLIQGQHPDVIARNFRRYGFGKSGAGGLAYRAETLIRTEAANIIEQAQKEAYKDHKIKEYYFMTAKDQRVCDKCAPLNGKLFSVDEAAQGKNYPPMHPCCRCTTKAKTRFDDNDDEYYKLYEDDYDAWYKKYVEPELDSLKKDDSKGIIDVEIDELTPCLRDSKTGRLVSTNVKKVSHDGIDNLTKNWKFDWSRVDEKADIFGLYVDGSKKLQGLVALEDRPDEQTIYVNLVESSPTNYGKNGAYKGVGGHLFAEACKQAKEKGYDYIYFDAKTALVEYYRKELNAVPISRQRMLIEGENLDALVERYYKEG